MVVAVALVVVVVVRVAVVVVTVGLLPALGCVALGLEEGAGGGARAERSRGSQTWGKGGVWGGVARGGDVRWGVRWVGLWW